jgi:uncharacterized protein (TIGR02611 family)
MVSEDPELRKPPSGIVGHDEIWGDEPSETDADAVVAEIEATDPGTAKRWHDHPAWVPFKAVGGFIKKSGKRIAVTIAGFTVVVVGIILIPLPGPGWLIVFSGLAILATEYVWARRLLNYAKSKVGQAKDIVMRKDPSERNASEEPPA